MGLKFIGTVDRWQLNSTVETGKLVNVSLAQNSFMIEKKFS